MLPSSQVFEVVAITKIGEQECVLGTYRSHDAAAQHALAVEMVQWDDVLVRKVAKPERRRPKLFWR